MKFQKIDFQNAKNGIIHIDERISVEENDFLRHTQVKSIPEVHITGTLQFDQSSLVFSNLELDGVMIVPDSITLEDLEVTFDTTSQVTYSSITLWIFISWTVGNVHGRFINHCL